MQLVHYQQQGIVKDLVEQHFSLVAAALTFISININFIYNKVKLVQRDGLALLTFLCRLSPVGCFWSPVSGVWELN
jgi:hypothetical protein